MNNLQVHDIVKWRDFSISSLYHNILRDAQNLNSKCLVKELEIISDAMKSETGRNFYSKSFLKATNVNIISRAFGCKYDIAGKKKKTIAKKPEQLQALCRNVITTQNYLIECLQVPIACVCNCIQKAKWYARSTILLTVMVPCKLSLLPPTMMELLCYPEWSHE